MGSYQATLIANQTLEFTIPAPCYRFQVTYTGGGNANTYITGDGTQPVIPVAETVTSGTQVCLDGAAGSVVSVRTPLPGSAIGGPGPAGPAGTTLPTVLMLSPGAPQVVVEW